MKFITVTNLSRFLTKLKTLFVDKTTYNAKITSIENSKQDKLTAHTGITISGNGISVNTSELVPPEKIRKIISSDNDSQFKSIEYDSSKEKYVLRDYDGTTSEDTKKVIATLDDIPTLEEATDAEIDALFS